MEPNLTTILTDLCITGQYRFITLSRGLKIQFREADEVNPMNRLCVYRVGTIPHKREFAEVRKRLQPLLGKRPLDLGEPFSYENSKGGIAHCRVFSWDPVWAEQGELL
jgi:hypothetical protein